MVNWPMAKDWFQKENTQAKKRIGKCKRLMLVLFAAAAVSLCACSKTPEISYVDTLPCDAENGYTWVAKLVRGSTGEVNLTQTYLDDDTYALLGASGVLENAFTGITPGLAIVRLYYVDPDEWDGYRSSASGVAYYEFQVYEDLTITLLYSEVELPDSF
jgi:hypothetical protein